MKSFFLKRLAVCLVAAVGFNAGIACAQTLSQEPLLSKAVNVRPNLSFIMDTSGSMGWACAYAPHAQRTIDDQFRPINSNDIPGTSANCLGRDNRGRSNDFRHSSPDNNFLIYDPRKLYPPGLTSAGAKQAQSVATWTEISSHKGDTASMASGGDKKGYSVIYALSAFSQVIGTSTVAQQTDSANYTVSWILEDAGAFGRVNSAGKVVSTTTNPFPQSGTRTDCGGTTCTYALERQNLQNWYTYHRSRLSAAKVGVNAAFTGLPDSFRMNYMQLSDTSISRSVKNYTDTIADFRQWVNDRTAADGTPLKRALNLVGQHYDNNTSNSGPWANTPWSPGSETATSHLSCRRSFAVMMTDGFWSDSVVRNASVGNSDGNEGPVIRHLNSTTVANFKYTPGGNDVRSKGKADLHAANTGYSDTLADYAHYYWSRDLRPNDLVNNVSDGKPGSPPFWQNLTLYTVGFGVDGTLNQTQINNAKSAQLNWPQPSAEQSTTVDDLKHAAHNGGGEYISVRDSADFASRLRNIILSIAGESSSQAGVAASSTVLQSGTKKFVPYYTTGEWWGNLSAINLDPSTGADKTPAAWQVVGTDANGRPTGTTTIPSFASRTVYVYVNTTTMAVPFTYSNLSSPNNLTGTATNQTTSSFTLDMANYIRGDRSQEGAGKLFRERLALLGDIVNSRPAFVKNTTDPASAYANLPSSLGGGTYPAYKSTKAARTEGVLFVGANDGMLHGFAENDGAEKFAFIPRSVLGNLHLLTDKNYALNHKMYVDGPLKESDAFISARTSSGSFASAAWTNVLTGTTGAGSKAVFALDVSNPLNMQGHHVLWEVSNLTSGFEELGHVLSEADTGVTPSGDWVAVFGNGYSSASGKASLFLVNLSTGAKVRELTTNTSTSNGLGGVRLVRNASSQVVGAYAGDLLGNLWRFDLSANSSSSWTDGQLLYSAKSNPGIAAQPITSAPAVFTRNDGRTGYIVVAGTGRLLTTEDSDPANSTFNESVYGLWDAATFGSTVTFAAISGRGALVQNTSVLSSTSTATNLYSSTSTVAMNWSSYKGWVLDYTILKGQRSIYPIEALKTLVRVDTIAPRSNTSSCTVDGEIKGINYLLDPYSGVCRARKTIDTNNDGKVDEADNSACVYSGQGDGTNTVLDPPTGSKTDLKFIIGATDKRLIDDGKDPDPIILGCNIATDPNKCRLRRDVRQVFIRK